ncbi:MAG: hypothetical protein JW953_04840 [Anaerolineae bacterium]|nr:hypothetical protein [Anaerolineae bacterium]
MSRCSRCQESVKADWQLCPHCGQPKPGAPGKIRCRVCGRTAAGGLQTCPHCGANLAAKPWPFLQFSFGVVILLGLLFGLWQVGPTFAHNFERAALALLAPPPTATPNPTFTPTTTSTSTPTTTSTFTPTTTPTGTSTLTATPTLTPTAQPTAAPVKVSAPAPTDTPTITPTPAPRYGKPTLLSPKNGQIFVKDEELLLKWQSMGALAENEWYAVRLRWLENGQLSFGGNNIKETFWIVPPDLYWGLADQSTGRKYEWFVFIEEITTDANGQQVGRAVSEVSDTASFLWQ